MAATITGAIKAILAGPLPTVPVFRDSEEAGGAPGDLWIVVHESLSRIPNPAESRNRRRRRELVQVDVWQKRTLTRPDDLTVALTVERTLEAAAGQVLTGGDSLLRFRPETTYRSYDQRTSLVREAITVAVTRHLT